MRKMPNVSVDAYLRKGVGPMDTKDVRPVGSTLYYLPTETRVPLKFGAETLTYISCARVSITVSDAQGRRAVGWGETPLSVQWAWPSERSYEKRHTDMKDFCEILTKAWAEFGVAGHPMEVGYQFIQFQLPKLLATFNRQRVGEEPMPWLAALICCSAFDIALHDAYGVMHGRDIYDLYGSEWMSVDLSHYLKAASDSNVSFEGKYPSDFFVPSPSERLPAWHLVGGKDPVAKDELTGTEPDDGYPVLLEDWIETDGLTCLKIKLTGTDMDWDYRRIVDVGHIAIKHDVPWLTCDFNCTVMSPDYVNDILDRLVEEEPRVSGMILYVEQPFPYDLETHMIDTRTVSARKPLFMDESAHDWQHVALGRSLGWTGVALKTCKTQTGALLSMCWAKAHGMTLMVQDLTNPMLAQIPHVRLAAHSGTIMGVETNAMQFYPEASREEAVVHPGLYTRKGGHVDLSTLDGPGFGYRIDEIDRKLPTPAASYGVV